jgi:hypothetical protein
VKIKPHLKQPKLKCEPHPSKIPKLGYGDDFHKLSPAWRVNLIELVGPFGWHAMSLTQILHVQKKLADFESMTWNQILIGAKYQNHLVEKEKICKDAQARLEAIGQEDVDHLVSLRLTGTERVWGILDRNVVKVLWWDPDHKVCPLLKRNT